MQYKRCIRCNKLLPLDSFYANNKASDGLSSKCKCCCLTYAHERYLLKAKDEKWVMNERSRGREKYRRLKYNEKYKGKETFSYLPSSYRNLHRAAERLGLKVKGKELHHWNYKELYSVFIVSRKAHKCIHRNMICNKSGFSKMKDGTILNTAEKAEYCFNKILKDNEINEKVIYVNLLEI
jgi:hypothetical protein